MLAESLSRSYGSYLAMSASERQGARAEEEEEQDIATLLSATSHMQAQQARSSRELLALLSAKSAVERSIVNKFRTKSGHAVLEFCPHGTVVECKRSRISLHRCSRVHFQRVIRAHTNVSMGNCAYLSSCKNPERCPFVHYQIDRADQHRLQRARGSADPDTATAMASGDVIATPLDDADLRTLPPQWVQCDVRRIKMEMLGKFSVIMADPPWDIHMQLPYGTMSDDEMRHLPIAQLQDDGFIFLWVTGRAMELGRECLRLWGYERTDELIWVKTNQLQRLIRTGRTGHWLNHSKEHCLIGRKGRPACTPHVDCDVLVAEVRDVSRKPDEIYGLIERLSPGTRKLELFGRPHNVQKNWVTLGNQLDGVHLVEPEMVARFRQSYPYSLETTQRMLLTGME